MQTARRDASICAALVIVAIYLHFPAQTFWYHAALEGRSFTSSWEWLDLGHLTIWVFEFIWGALIGAIVGFFVRTAPVRWALICGVLVGLVRFAMSTDYFFPTTPPSTYVWVYGAYVVPMAAAALAAWGVVSVRNIQAERGKHAV